MKVLLVGDVGTGKTSIVERLCRDRVPEYVSSTIGFDFRTTEYDGMTYNFWDAAGMERFRCILPMYFRGVSMTWIVVDSSSADAACQARYWALECRKHTDRPLVLVVNKSDLPAAGHDWTAIAAELGIPYVRASVKSNSQLEWFAKLIPFLKNTPSPPPIIPHICLGIRKTNDGPSSCCS